MKARGFTVPVDDTPQTMQTQVRTPRSFDPRYDEEISSFDPRHDESGQEAVQPMHTAMQTPFDPRVLTPVRQHTSGSGTPFQAGHPRPMHSAVQSSPSTVQQSKPKWAVEETKAPATKHDDPELRKFLD